MTLLLLTLVVVSTLEVWVDSPILWLACRRHVAELVVVSLGGKVDGFTFKLPGPDP